MFRASVLSTLGINGDKDTLAEANRRFTEHLKGKAISVELRGIVKFIWLKLFDILNLYKLKICAKKGLHVCSYRSRRKDLQQIYRHVQKLCNGRGENENSPGIGIR